MSELVKKEEETLAFWKERKIFEKSLAKPAPNGDFIFYDGPPFATGLPHHGSLLSSVIKDVVPRYKTMRGYRVPRRWGWDCHGLPIENLIEKRLNLKTKKDILDIGIDTFNEAARASVLEFDREWEKYIERIGRWVDFKNSYKTMDNSYIESVWWALKELHRKKLLYEGQKVLMYCPHCETPLAKAEIAMDNTYKDVTEDAVTVKFKVKEPAKHGLPDNSYLLAWTTTPWTLPGNVALAVGKDIDYALVRIDAEESREVGGGELQLKSGHYLMSSQYFKEAAQAAGDPGSLVRTIPGSELVGIEYEPLFEVPALESAKSFRVYAADFVTMGEGTGVVHTAVMYGEDDFVLGHKEGLPMVQLLEANGHYNARAPEFLRGEYLRKGNKLVIEELKRRGLFFAGARITHSYPHCHRCGTALIYNAVPSWFINIQKVKSRMLSENEKITWVPEHLKHGRFKNNVESAPDWTISRNRFWASPLPIWKCEKCTRLEVIGSLQELKERSGGAVPQNAKGELDLHRPYIDAIGWACTCGGAMHRVPEVVDGWVESGAMPFASAGYPQDKSLVDPAGWWGFSPKGYPADFIAEYIAQTRTWFYYMHAMGVLLFKRSSFRTVVSTGTILARDGAKMSKSLGNFTNPLLVMDQYGADALRLYLMGSVVMQGEDLNFRDEDVREAHNRTLGILWNSFKFYELYKNQHDGSDSTESPHLLDRWIMSRLNKTILDTTEAMDAYDTPRAAKELRAFVDDYSTWYVRRSRERVKNPNLQDKQRSLGTQRKVLLTLAKLMAPLTPFIAESIFRGIGAPEESVHLCAWPEAGAVDTQLLADMARTRELASRALQAREKEGIRIRQPLGALKVRAALPAELKTILAEEINVKEVIEDAALDGDLFLDTTLTQALREEGALRDWARSIQEWRKEKGFSINDRPGLLITTSVDAGLLKKHREELMEQTNLLSLEVKEALQSEEPVRTFERL